MNCTSSIRKEKSARSADWRTSGRDRSQLQGMQKANGFSIRFSLFLVFFVLVLLNQVGFSATINVPADYSTIQAGIDASNNSDTVLVQSGTYIERINFNGKNIVVISAGGPEVTIIDGNFGGSVVTFNTEETSAAVLSGFTIQNGRWTGPSWAGGGIHCDGASPSLENLIVSGNSSEPHGGGIYLGGPTSPNIVNTVISGNTTEISGGGIFCNASSPTLVNVTVNGNTATLVGGGGGGISFWNSSNPYFVNSILWGNIPDEIWFSSDGGSPNNTVTITYSDVQGGLNGIVTNNNGTVNWGAGNINANPNFVDAANGDFHLQTSSPCIDSGDPTSDPDPDGTMADMGAYYFDQSSGGRIDGSVTLTEDHPFGQVQIILYLPGGGTLVQQWGEDPPFDLNYFFEDPAIAEGGPYRVEASFDLNDNNQYDGGEPYFTTGDLYISASTVLENVDLQLASGGDFRVEPLVPICGGADGNACDPANVGVMEAMVDGDINTSGGLGGVPVFSYEFRLQNGSQTINQINITNGFWDLEVPCNWMSSGSINLWDAGSNSWIQVADIDNPNPDKYKTYFFSDFTTDAIQLIITQVGGNQDSGCHAEIIEIQAGFSSPSGGFSFDFGMGGYAETDFTALDGGPEITMEMFIKLHSSPVASGIYEFIHRAEWGFLDYVGDGTVRFSLFNIGEINWVFTPSIIEWHHIAGDYDGSNMRLYWDGVVVATQPASGNLSSSSSPLRIGEGFDGFADVIRISDIALYQGNNFDPWTQDYNPTTNTRLLYNCNEGSGNQLIDDSGFNRHATLSGNPTWDPDEPLGGSAGIFLWFGLSSTNYVDLNWDRWPDPDGEFVNLELRRQVNNPGITESSPLVYGETDVNVVTWRDNDITEGNNYYYKMYMYDQTGLRYESLERSFPPGTAGGHVEGNIHSNETRSGQLIIGLFDPGNGGNEWDPNHQIELNASFPSDQFYQFDDPSIGDAVGWQVKAFLDENSNSSADSGELYGESGQFTVSGGFANDVDFDLVADSPDFPVISNFSITSGDAYIDNNVSISVDLTASSGIETALCKYYKGGDITTVSIDLDSLQDEEWTGIIPAGEVTMEGLMVQVYANSNNGFESTSDWVEVPVYFNSYTFRSIVAEQYAMVSFPGDLDDDGVKSVLENNLGDYDPAQWRSFSYNNSSGSYDENSGSFKPGNAFWVVSRESVNLAGGSGKVTSLENTYTITLDPGWNMVGNPYAFSLDFPDRVTATGDVEMTLYGYNGSGYVNAGEMVPGEGYWIWSNEDGALLDFDHQPSGGSQKQMEGGWQIDLHATINGYHDFANRIGIHPLAENERDGMDAHEPPVIGSYVQLAIQNADWKDKGIYSKDIRKEGDKNYSWNVFVKSNMAGQISFEAFDTQNIPGEFDAVLVDLDNMIQHDLRSSASYQYVSIGDEKDHHFQVIIGLPENVSKSIIELGILPSEFAVDQNAPNPFNPVTAIRIQLAEDAVVTMKVFNILGEEVTTLIHNEFMESGYRQIIWNGRDNASRQLPSGLYLYQTIMKNEKGQLLHMNTKKMVLVK